MSLIEQREVFSRLPKPLPTRYVVEWGLGGEDRFLRHLSDTALLP